MVNACRWMARTPRSAAASSSAVMCGVRMLKPDNNELAGRMTCMEGGAFMEPVTLPSTGPYTVLVDPVSAASGTLTLTLFDVPPDASGSLAVNGSEVPLALTGPGQKARLTFTI